ncbi:Gfo/Idh/MocA family protein [Paenibacillus cymbidii]|uniref:Gfo/Idh/MocA family protein n=1 Tax=Paenibacillus cymbidii TaxID=1639034 RepID=UPI0010810842|nr:Gfo/Idh/MocA family oxidoreductase [Paenibacillus cymbidii]
MKRLKIGMIGLGEVAQIIHLPILEMLGCKYEIAAICDISASLLSYIGEKYKVPDSSKYGDYRELVKQPGLDAVFVLNSDEHHKDCAVTALREGLHVFVEKPMCLTKADAESIIREKHASGKQVMVGYMRRFAPAFRLALDEVIKLEKINYVHIRAIIGSNRLFIEQSSDVYRPNDLPAHLGEERATRIEAQQLEALGEHTSAEKRRMYGLLSGLGCHDLSAMRHMLGMPRGVISAVAAGNFWHVLFDYGSFMASYEVGTDRQRRFDAYIEVFGPEKTVKVQYNTPYIRQLPTALHIQETVGDSHNESVVRPTFKDAYVEELEHWYEVVTQGADPVTTAEDYMQDLELFRMIVDRLVAVQP